MIRFALVIPTLNEARRLPATLTAARAAFGASAEYIVTDGGSTDATCTMAQQGGAQLITGSAGRGVQLQRGLEAATAEICLFLHADTFVPATAAVLIEQALHDPNVAGGAFSLEFSDLGNHAGVLRLLQRAINLRARVFRSATGDQVIFARRSVLLEVGGVPRVPLFEDVRLCRALKRQGKFVILPARVATSARFWQRAGALRGILLHWSFRALHALGASPVFLARHYPLPR